MSLEISECPQNHHHNLCRKHIHCLQNFPPTIFIYYYYFCVYDKSILHMIYPPDTFLHMPYSILLTIGLWWQATETETIFRSHTGPGDRTFIMSQSREISLKNWSIDRNPIKIMTQQYFFLSSRVMVTLDFLYDCIKRNRRKEGEERKEARKEEKEEGKKP